LRWCLRCWLSGRTGLSLSSWLSLCGWLSLSGWLSRSGRLCRWGLWRGGVRILKHPQVITGHRFKVPHGRWEVVLLERLRFALTPYALNAGGIEIAHVLPVAAGNRILVRLSQGRVRLLGEFL